MISLRAEVGIVDINGWERETRDPKKLGLARLTIVMPENQERKVNKKVCRPGCRWRKELKLAGRALHVAASVWCDVKGSCVVARREWRFAKERKTSKDCVIMFDPGEEGRGGSFEELLRMATA